MNGFHMISRVLVMTSVVSVASVSAAYNMDQYKNRRRNSFNHERVVSDRY